MIATERKPLGHFLLTRGVVTQEQIDRALEEQRLANHQKLIGELLVEKSFCTDEQIIEALAEAYDVPFARVSPRIADPKVMRLLSREFLEKHHVLPMFLVEGTLTIAVSEPANMFLVEEISRVTTHNVQIVASTVGDIDATLRVHLPGANAFVVDDLIDDADAPEITVLARRVETAGALEPLSGDSPVIRLVNFCIQQAVKDSANDIHIEPSENTLRIRYRIDGRLIEKLHPPISMHGPIAARLKSMANLDVSERRLPQDGDIRALIGKRSIDLRVSTMPGKWGETIVVRILDHQRVAASLEKLGFGYDSLKKWRKVIARPDGLLIVAGPTGSGKTATLYASLQEVNSGEVNICTLEDPIFGGLAGVNQFQINDQAGLTFPAALQSVLRQHPDIVMVGETRDPETARLATQAALTGHLILTTLHTSDAPSAITRLFNLGVEPYLVGASLTGVMAQRLVRKLCQTCKEPYAPTITERRHLEKFSGSAPDALYRPKGCPRCRNVGYHGRVGLYELLIPDDTLSDRLSHGAALPEIREIARKLGMKSLREDGVEKVKAGITTLEEVYRVTA